MRHREPRTLNPPEAHGIPGLSSMKPTAHPVPLATWAQATGQLHLLDEPPDALPAVIAMAHFITMTPVWVPAPGHGRSSFPPALLGRTRRLWWPRTGSPDKVWTRGSVCVTETSCFGGDAQMASLLGSDRAYHVVARVLGVVPWGNDHSSGSGEPKKEIYIN